MSNKKSTFDKLILGAIIGAAVGSVIGASVAPEEGKNTRKKITTKIKDLTADIKQKIVEQDPLIVSPPPRIKQSILSKFFNKFKKVDGKPIPNESDAHETIK